MKRFFASKGGRICVACLAVLLLAGMGFGGWLWWSSAQKPHFQDVSIELGEQLPDISAFLTEDANPEKTQMVTPEDQIDLSHTGTQTLEFTHGNKKETVTLTIVDTTAPIVTFRDVTVDINTVLTPEDFVAEIVDLSETSVSFAQPLSQPESYGEAAVEVVVTDAHGNKTTEPCRIYYIWMHPTFQLELGMQVTKADLLLDPEKDDALLDQTKLDEINAAPVGEYTVISTDGDQSNQCVITVSDTVAPTLELKAVKIDSNKTVSLEDFIVSASDISGEVTITLLTQPDCKAVGIQTIVVEARDINGNVTTAETTLQVSYDSTPPTFSGVASMTVEKHSTPDYETGVSARDSRDGTVTFTYDASKVNTAAAGTYYVVYSATDRSGNTATYRRKVTVNPDAEDTAALVDSIAAKLSSDVEEIRDYVRNKIYYSSNWGGDDPVWFGFKEKQGNCYVHARCLEVLLKRKGYQTQLIWCEDKTHYWNLVYINGTWRHVDSTPGVYHSRYSLMTDDQRYETLTGRDWDREKWPACE